MTDSRHEHLKMVDDNINFKFPSADGVNFELNYYKKHSVWGV